MNYYGTNLTEYGHYFWILEGMRFVYKGLNGKDEPVPFEPDNLISSNAAKGTAGYFAGDGYSIYAISGSCKDTRGGTKSVFWVKGDVGPGALKDMILATPLAKKMIEQMPFEVKW
ncbi:MAG: hypothetical protein ACRYFX_18730 [Janthinobacterium lividum]